jgi:type VI secretion system ImpB/VipA family protein
MTEAGPDHGGADTPGSLPFVVGVLADLTGDHPRPPLAERDFVTVDSDSLDVVIHRLRPQLRLEVADPFAPDSVIPVELDIRSLADFDPPAIAAQVPALTDLADRRAALVRLLWQTELDDALRGRLALELEACRVLGADPATLDAAWLSRLAERVIATLDDRFSILLSAVLHHPRLLALEATWRGIASLVQAAQPADGTAVVVRLLDLSHRELIRDVHRAVEFDQTNLFRLVWRNELMRLGGKPFGLLLGDYAVAAEGDDLDVLRSVSAIAAACGAVFLSAAAPAVLGLADWRDLPRPNRLDRLQALPERRHWAALRETDDARWTVLTTNRVLARAPHGSAAPVWAGAAYTEAPPAGPDACRRLPHAHFCWMSAAYPLAERIIAATRQGGGFAGPLDGRLAGLPVFRFLSEAGQRTLLCPAEIGLDTDRAAEVVGLGLTPLLHVQYQDTAVFPAVPTLAGDAERIGDAALRLACGRIWQHAAMQRPRLATARDADACQAMLEAVLPPLPAGGPVRSVTVRVTPAAGADHRFDARITCDAGLNEPVVRWLRVR